MSIEKIENLEVNTSTSSASFFSSTPSVISPSATATPHHPNNGLPTGYAILTSLIFAAGFLGMVILMAYALHSNRRRGYQPIPEHNDRDLPTSGLPHGHPKL